MPADGLPGTGTCRKDWNPMPAPPFPDWGPKALARESVRPEPPPYLLAEPAKVLTAHDDGRTAITAAGVPQARDALPHVPSRQLPLQLLTAQAQTVADDVLPMLPPRLPSPRGHRVGRQEFPHPGRADRPHHLTLSVAASLQAQRARSHIPAWILAGDLRRDRLLRRHHDRRQFMGNAGRRCPLAPGSAICPAGVLTWPGVGYRHDGGGLLAQRGGEPGQGTSLPASSCISREPSME